ncbi:helix-turn-helix domain-containing protein [Azospirillum sp.]|uniref:helix-turn-helix domain-containing protein n=1 Tax=Azospirillum sp. TaxID=34012 RepID=UPI002D4444FB|nr:helix-turn-helix domain-containing protein [Azospirillum sp.]HYD64012.1 helix-turn-helix domain-containing protein [Azospirillum sp.]
MIETTDTTRARPNAPFGMRAPSVHAGAGPLPQFTYAAGTPDGDLPGADAFWTWRRIMAPLYDIAVHAPAYLADFQGAASWFHFDRMLLVTTDAAPHRLRRSPMTIARTAVDHCLIQRHSGAGWRGRLGTRDWSAGDGDVSVLDLTQPFDLEAEGATAGVVVPRRLLAPLLGTVDALHGVVAPGRSPQGRMLGDHLLSLSEQARQWPRRNAVVATTATVAVIAACLQPAPDHAVANLTERAPSLIAIKRHIEERLTEPDLAPETIARDCGVSRTNLYRLFEPMGGVAQYIRERRLLHCYAEIVSPAHAHRRIGDIAYDWGFPDETVFSRAFRRCFGLSPREARAARRDGGPAPLRGSRRGTADALELDTPDLWLRALGGR